MTGRVFDHAFAWHMTARQFADAAALLAAACERSAPVDQVIGIAQGGLRPAQAIASRLGARLRVVRARHNPTGTLYTQATGQVSCAITGIGAGSIRGSVLIVDDICGTGATLQAVTSALTPLAAPGARLHTAALCRNAGARTAPGLVVWDNLREWVVFPWEPRPPAGTPLRTLPDPTEAHAA